MRMIKLATVLGTTAVLFALAAPAHAQATRTWVSGVGDDVNPCSRTAPCKTFAGAISKTAAGGEINCLDPGGFGAVTIIKSMTISCPYTEGGALAGGNGIVVNMPAATDVAFIRGLDIFGVNPPTNGIRFVNQGTLHVEDTTIRRFNALNSQGISFQPSGPAQLYISNVTVAENGNGASGGGILIQPTGASGSAKVVMRNVRVSNNANIGLRVDTTGNSSAVGTNVSIARSVFSGSSTGISATMPAGASTLQVMVDDSQIAHNSANGAAAFGTGSAVIRISGSSITGNPTPVLNSGGGTVRSYGDNLTDGNGAAAQFTPPLLTKG